METSLSIKPVLRGYGMKILFIGVFDSANRSTNNAQLRGFLKEGCEVIGFNYRAKAAEIGSDNRDQMIIDVCRERQPDLVVFSKCAEVATRVFRECTAATTTCLWWMDPLSTLEQIPEMLLKANEVHLVCTGIKNTLEVFRKANPNIYHVLEGYDDMMHKPHDLQKDLEVTFIGSLHSERRRIMDAIEHPVAHLTNVYAYEHAKTVSRSKINLNFSTAGGGSDRVYKVLGAGGFLLTSDWEGREELFESGKDLVVYKDVHDLNKKIAFYLENEDKRNTIAMRGHQTVQGMTKNEWARKIIKIYEEKTKRSE